MSNLQQQHQLTQKIHELLPLINQKYGLEIKAESDYYFYIAGNKYPKPEVKKVLLCNKKDTERLYDVCVFGDPTTFGYDKLGEIPAIQAPQIRQILVGLKEVLGENPEYNEINEASWSLKLDEIYAAGYHSAQPRTYAEALCQKWLDGLNPLFDREPETVLQELVDILENLLK